MINTSRGCLPTWAYCLAVIVSAAFVRPAAATTYTVGSDLACTHSDLNSALLAAAFNTGPDEIRVATNQTYTAQWVVLDDQDLTLIGGYSSCSDPTPSGRTTISGAGGSTKPTIQVHHASGSRITVALANLQITGGEASGIDVAGIVTLSLANILVESNSTAASGGGITVDGTDAAIVSIDENSAVQNNTATGSGGGIYCSGGGSIGLVGALVSSNHADIHGGGARVKSGCVLNAFSSAGGGISNNSAGNSGGGIHVGLGAMVNLNGDGTYPFRLENNTAGGSGGGLSAVDTGTTVSIVDSSVAGNSTGFNGSGLHVATGATLVMERQATSCSRGVRCSAIAFNGLLSGSSQGGAVAVELGGSAEIRQTWIRGNFASLNPETALVEDTGSQLTLEGVMLFKNQTTGGVLASRTGGLLRLAFVSTTGNLQTGGFLLDVDSTSTCQLYSSVIGETTGDVFNTFSGSTVTIDCVIAHETASFPIVPASVAVVTDPATLFVDPAGGDLHLLAGAPAVDYCDTKFYTPVDADIDGEPRGFDDPAVVNAFGAYDLGADESAMIFGDGFESGDTTAWSATVGGP